jgi:hypothetical protein
MSPAFPLRKNLAAFGQLRKGGLFLEITIKQVLRSQLTKRVKLILPLARDRSGVLAMLNGP